MATIPSRGPFSTGRLIPITIKPDARDGETATVSINSVPPYGAPSVRTGPLEVTVTVGTPKRQTARGVLLAGGLGPDGIESSAQVYDYTSNQIYDAPSSNVARVYHTATRLKGGRVLVAGGATLRGLSGGPDTVTATSEIYDPAALKWIPTGSLNTARERHTATRLSDGKVLITGGVGTGGTLLASAELYDPATGKFAPAGNMLEPRHAHYAVLLPNSGTSAKVLVYGGLTPGGVNPNGAEICDESTGTFTAAGATAPRGFWTPFTPKPVSLANGELDIIGGKSENGSPTGDETLLTLDNPPSFSASAEKLNHPRSEHTLTALTNDEGLLVTGGVAGDGSILRDAEIRDANGWSLLDAKMISPRSLHTATRLPNGQVFVAGGNDPLNPVGSSELYDPRSNEFKPGPEMLARWSHTATLFSTTTTVLAVSPPKAIFGQSVALSAQVTAGFGTPTGTVQFLDGSTVIATATLSEGQANTNYDKFTPGSHTLTAVYSGDDINGQSTSDPVTVNVALAGSSVGLSSSANPSQWGQDVTFTATVQLQSGTGDTATETITFKDGDTELGSKPLNNNQATFTDRSLKIGTHEITAVYSGDATHGGGTSPVINQQVTQRATNITLKATPANPVFGNTVTLTSTVSYVAKALRHSADFTGTVTFKDGDTVLDTANLKDDTAIFKISSLHASTHRITATYSGDSTSSSSTSPVLTLTVAQESSQTSLESSENPSTVGESVTFTARVTSSAGTPSGTVLFSDGDKPIGSAQRVVNGTGNLSTSALSAGEHLITAAYSGDEDFLSSSSSAVQQRVESAKVDTSTSLSGAPNPAAIDTRVTFSVKVTPASGSKLPTGSVILKNGESVLATLSLSGGSASFRTSSLSAGKHSITARYEGDSDFDGSTSPVFTEEVNAKVGTSTSVTADPNPAAIDTAVTFTVKVTPASGSDLPTGSVILKDGESVLATLSLNGGAATFVTSSLSAGNHSITATYDGDSDFDGSTSPVFTEVVNGLATPVVELTSSPNPSKVGQSVTFTAKVSSPGGPTPRGSITISEPLPGGQNVIYGSAPLKDGVATVLVDNLTAGTHEIRATYGGEPGVYTGAESKALTQLVNEDTAQR